VAGVEWRVVQRTCARQPGLIFVKSKSTNTMNGCITLRGVAVHNLKHLDLDLPREKLIVFCGVSGSGKTSLALDTLYAEGQRRYIESFSAYTRQFLEQLEKPEAERIEGIPPAVAVTHKNTTRSSRSTVGTATETTDYLRLLFAKIGRVVCRGCEREIRPDTPETAAERLLRLTDGQRYVIAFPRSVEADRRQAAELIRDLSADGFTRVIAGGRTFSISDAASAPASEDQSELWHVVVDRLTAGQAGPGRVRDSLELAFEKGSGRCVVFVQEPEAPDGSSSEQAAAGRLKVRIDGRTWSEIGFSTTYRCEDCGRDYAQPQARLFSFNSPLGACPACEGFGNIIDIDLDLIVPDPRKSIREGAIATWTTPAYASQQQQLLEVADRIGVPVDVPFAELTPEQRTTVIEGSPRHHFDGLRGFFAWLERRKYKMHLRVFLSRWRSYRTCSACRGARLCPEALSVKVGDLNLAEFSALKIDDAIRWIRSLRLTEWERSVGGGVVEQIETRLRFLQQVGLDYLTIDRTLRTLSGGEAQRVALTSTLGSSLVNMLYVLDEPSVGLHARDVDRLVGAIEGLRDRGNTVVLVEHEESVLRRADHIVEIGPGAGERGGEVVFQGTLAEMESDGRSLTGDYLCGRRGLAAPGKRRRPDHGWIRLNGARGNNLKNLTVEFPLGILCVVTGVSGSGKSTLVEDTLYPALCRRKRKEAPKPGPSDDVFGDGQIDDVILVDQSPIGRSPRSNPVTYIKAFDAIRAVFADTVHARTHNYPASHFSFNVDGGRCSACRGEGFIEIDMQFLADVYMKCPQCKGKRYRREILDVTHRGRSIADVLDMTVREAFLFFRGQSKVQVKLKRLIDVGLDYLRLGQPANTLSAGEAQRLKLAGHMSATKRGRTLFILDEPTTGLHFSDVVQLLDCFEALLSVGHSLIVVEHNLQIMQAADYIIDLGPGAADEGGRIVAQGTPEEIAACEASVTGRFLAPS
jgi:excinuclease ABC subunit A